MSNTQERRQRPNVSTPRGGPRRLALVLCIATFCLSAAGAAAQAAPPPPQFSLAFNQKYQDASLWFQYKAAAVAKTHEVLMAVVASSPPGTPSKSYSVRLWVIDPTGARKSETLIAPPTPAAAPGATPAANAAQPAARPTEPDVTALAVLDNGDALLVVEFTPLRPVLVKVNRAGKQTLAQELLGPQRRATLTKIIPTTDGKLILAGHESFDALAVKVDEAGKLLWEKLEDRGRMDLFVDGVATENGGALLVGNTGAYDMMRAGPSILWVGRYGPTGSLVKEVSMPGRYGGIAAARGGGFVVVYDKSSTAPQDIRAQMYGPDWKKGWETPILNVEGGIAQFQLAAQPDGGFVVAGAKYALPFAARLGANGSVVGTFWGDKLEQAVVYDLVAAPGEYYVASSVYAKNESNKVVRQVRLLKLN